MTQKETIANPVCTAIAQLLWEWGVRHTVVSPGTRSAPLTVAIHRHGGFKTRVVVDERCAAFVALGVSLANNGAPVALVCTSGSAMLNWAPALAEAFYRRIPLIAISADRPARWVDQRDSQTMRQDGALDAVVRKWINIPTLAASDRQMFELANIHLNDALYQATSAPVKGPVHINVELDVPLTAMTSAEPEFKCKKVTVFRPEANAESLAELIKTLHGKKVILAIADGDYNCSDACHMLPILAEASANVPHSVPLGQIDRYLSENQDIDPEVVITLGHGSFVSARFKSWLRHRQGLTHISAGFDDNTNDTFGAKTVRVECEPSTFVRALAQIEADRKFNNSWREFADISRKRTQERVEGSPVLSAVQYLANHFTGNVHASNGSVVRYCQCVDHTWKHFYSNRGISGIDGCTSTALGFALESTTPTVLITGDMSAAYDISALAAAAPPKNFKIVVIDNSGGDIFRNISATRALPELEEFFATTHRVPFGKIAKAFAYDYFETDCTSATCHDIIDEFLNHKHSAAMLRLVCPPELSPEL